MANEMTFTKVISERGTNRQYINVDPNGRPYAQLWTFKDNRSEWHPWHLKTNSGFYRTFGGGAYQKAGDKKAAAMDAMLFCKHLADAN